MLLAVGRVKIFNRLLLQLEGLSLPFLDSGCSAQLSSTRCRDLLFVKGAFFFSSPAETLRELEGHDTA